VKNSDEIRLDMAIPVICPFSGKLMIETAVWQPGVSRKQIEDFHQGGIESLAVPP
jgi:hypothetical protein